MNDGIKILLERLFYELESLNVPLLELFNSGIAKEQVVEMTKNLPIHLSDEVYQLYAWRNGIHTELTSLRKAAELELFSSGIFQPLHISVKTYRYYALENTFWDPSMFPLFSSGIGDFHLINSDPINSDYGMIWYFSNSLPEFEGLVSKYDSLNNLLYSTLECFRQKAYTFQAANPQDFADGPFLEVNYDLEGKICKAINPKSEYWKMFN